MTFNYRQQYHEYQQYIRALMTQTKSPVTQASLAVVGSLLFAAFLLVAAIRPTVSIIASILREINDERMVIAALDQKTHSLQIAQQKLLAIESQLPSIDNAIPRTIDFSETVRTIELIASHQGVKKLEVSHNGYDLKPPITTSSKTRAYEISEVSFTIDVGGDESNVLNFVRELESADRIMKIKRIEILAVADERRQEQSYAIAAEIDVVSYTTQPMAEPSQLPGKSQLQVDEL